jgi:hypothetical protein
MNTRKAAAAATTAALIIAGVSSAFFFRQDAAAQGPRRRPAYAVRPSGNVESTLNDMDATGYEYVGSTLKSDGNTVLIFKSK